MRFRSLAIAALMSSCLSAAAGDVPLSYAPVFQEHADRDGQHLGGVTSLLQSHDGYLWVGTMGGLKRFDGESFTLFDTRSSNAAADGFNTGSLSSNRVTSLLEDDQHRLWIGTQDGGLNLLDANHFTHVDMCDGTCQIYTLAEHDGAIWAATDIGLLRIDPDSLRSERLTSSGRKTHAMAITAEGRMYLAVDDEILWLDNGEYQSLAHPDELRDMFGMLIEGDNLLVATGSDLYRLAPDTGQWTALDIGATHSLDRQPDGSILAGTRSGKVYRLLPGGSPELQFLLNTPGSSARHARMDHEGNLWIGGGSLYRVRIPTIGLLADPEINLDGGARAISEDHSGDFWFVPACDGVRQWRAHGEWVNWATQPPAESTCIETVLTTSDNTVWLGSAGGHLLRIPPERGKGPQLAYRWNAHLPVLAIYEKQPGTLLVSGQRATREIRYHSDSDQIDVRRIPALENLVVLQIVPARQGGLWFVGNHGAVRMIDDEVVEEWTSDKHESLRFARALHEGPDGVLWIGTYGNGLNRIEENTLWNYDRTNGLIDNTISCLLEDDSQNIWIAGNQGASMLLPGSATETSIQTINFGKNDGMNPAEINGGHQNSCIRDSRGRFWLSLVSGFAMMEPDRYDAVAPASPLTHIERVSVNGTAHSPTAPLRLAASARNIDIGYTAIQLTNPERLRFRFRLAGIDTNWSDAGTSRSIVFPSLPWGTYTFQVQSRLENGAWPDNWAELKIDHPAPWYQRPWVWLTSTLLALVLLLDTTWHRPPRKSGGSGPPGAAR